MISTIIKENNDISSMFYYIPNFLQINEEKKLFNYLENICDFKSNPKFTKGTLNTHSVLSLGDRQSQSGTLNTHSVLSLDDRQSQSGISRKQKWFQKDGKYFCPLWKERYEHWKSHEMDHTIIDLINKIQNDINIMNIIIPNINSCLINKYPDGNHFIAPHRDSELSFGLDPTIIILSIGQTRTIKFNRVDKEKNKNFSLELESGSIFIMSGSSQRFFNHSIDKESCTNVRYSLTFREFIL